MKCHSRRDAVGSVVTGIAFVFPIASQYTPKRLRSGRSSEQDRQKVEAPVNSRRCSFCDIDLERSVVKDADEGAALTDHEHGTSTMGVYDRGGAYRAHFAAAAWQG